MTKCRGGLGSGKFTVYFFPVKRGLERNFASPQKIFICRNSAFWCICNLSTVLETLSKLLPVRNCNKQLSYVR